MKTISKLNLDLIRAARKGFDKVVNKFIKDGANPIYLEEEHQINALRAAIENNDQDAINILIEAGVTLPTEEENQINTPGTEIENNNPNTIILKEAEATQTANHAPSIPDMDFSNTIFPQSTTPPHTNSNITQDDYYDDENYQQHMNEFNSIPLQLSGATKAGPCIIS